MRAIVVVSVKVCQVIVIIMCAGRPDWAVVSAHTSRHDGLEMFTQILQPPSISILTLAGEGKLFFIKFSGLTYQIRDDF